MNELTAGDSAKRWYEAHIKKPLEEWTNEDIAAARPAAIRDIAAAAEGIVFVKTHNAMVSHLGSAMIEPSVTAGAIYIVRNPLDVAISYSHFMGRPIDDVIERMAMDGAIVETSDKQVYQYFGSWQEHVHSWTRRPVRQLHIMRYEDMLAKPQETFGRLAEFLRLRVAPEQIDEAIAASSFDNLKAQEDEAGFREKPKTAERFFRAGRADQWREVLTQAQVAKIVRDNKEQMARFGYLPK
jgi:hypothetical protein